MLLLLTGAVFLFLKYIAPLAAPVLTAMLFVTIFGNTLKRLQDKFHIHRQIGAVLLLIGATLLIVLLVWILFSWIIGSLPAWLKHLELFEKDLTELVGRLCAGIGETLGVDRKYLEGTVLGMIQEVSDYFRQEILPGVLSHSLLYIRALGTFGGFLIVFIIASVLLAKDYDTIMNRLLDREEFHVLLEVICGVIRYIATFVRAQLVIIVTVAGIAAAVLGFAGVKQGVLWGLLAGIMDVLPFVGTGVVLIPLGAVQLFQGFYARGAACFLLYVGCIFLRELLEPRLIGRRMGISPLAVLVSLYAGIQLFGVGGIIKGPLGFIIIYESYHSLSRRQSDAPSAETDCS